MKGQVLTDDGTLHQFVNVYVDDDDVRYLEKLDTKVADGVTRVDPARRRRRLSRRAGWAHAVPSMARVTSILDLIGEHAAGRRQRR